jgi:hypothetical protein
MTYNGLKDTIGSVDIPSISKILTDDFNAYLDKTDIDNGEVNDIIGTPNQYPKYASQAFICPSPMSSDLQRKAFPGVYYFNGYSFLTYLAGETHSPNALKPYTLEIIRSDDLFVTNTVINPKVINDSGTMRAIDPSLDGFFVNQSVLTYADSKLWILFGVFDFTVNPPVLASDWIGGKTYAAYSSDYGDTWSELIEIDSSEYVPSSKPIIVGNEIWYTGYGAHTYGMASVDLHSFLIKYNVLTGSKSKTQLDVAWTGLSTSEPAILEYVSGKYVCVARVNWNANYEGAETEHKGMVVAYSTDGSDFSDYSFSDESDNYPNQPKLFMYKDVVYLSYGMYLTLGTVASDESEVEWIVRNPAGETWNTKYGYYFYQFLGSNDAYLYRFDPRVGEEENERALLGNGQGSVDFCAVDETKDILLATLNFKNDTYYIGEPWVSIIKRNGVGTGPVYTERLLYLYEIPGDGNTSNTIKLWNDWLAEGDEVLCAFIDNEDRPNFNISLAVADNLLTMTSSGVVKNQKVIVEIIK